MKIIFAFLIFCIVLFIYLHVQFHLKTSNDLEIYEVEDASKDKLENVCNLRQPTIINYSNEKIMNTCNTKYITDNYYAFDIKIRNNNDSAENSDLYVPLVLHSSLKLFNEDKQSNYYSDNNGDFLEETGLKKHFVYNDSYLRPYMVSNCNYDILMGSLGSATPFKYTINYRNYFMVTQGSIKIKLATPQSIKYLYPEYDYDNFEFRSTVNIWAPQNKFLADYDKIKFLEVVLRPGQTFYLPAYWWYSIKILESGTSVAIMNYRTYMNNVAVSPYYALHGLQLLNVKRNSVKISDAPTSIHTVNDEMPHEAIVQQNTEQNISQNTEQPTQQNTEPGTRQINTLPNANATSNANTAPNETPNTNITLSQSVDIVPYVPTQGVASTAI
jgi:sRNA-binding carbon storage regulator CsrA